MDSFSRSDYNKIMRLEKDNTDSEILALEHLHLNGFNDLIEIKISDNQQIGNIIVLVKNELELKNDYTIEKHKQLVVDELRERGYDDKTIEEWIEFI